MVALWLSACGPSEDAPIIESLEFLQNSPFNPNELSFLLTFADRDGDLFAGATTLFIDDTRISELSNLDLFRRQRPPVDLVATRGTLEVVVELEAPPEPDVELRFAFEMSDAANNASNRPQITLRVVGP